MYKGTARPFMGQWRSVDVFKSLDSITRAKKKKKKCWNVCACVMSVCANACGRSQKVSTEKSQ